MKLRIKKSELRECIENAVIMALNEAQQKNVVKEGYYDDDEEDIVNRFLRDPKNQIPKDKNAKKAAAAFRKDKEKEDAVSRHDDEAIAKRAQAEKPDNEG